MRLPYRTDRPAQRATDGAEQFDEYDVFGGVAGQDLGDVVFEPKQ